MSIDATHRDNIDHKISFQREVYPLLCLLCCPGFINSGYFDAIRKIYTIISNEHYFLPRVIECMDSVIVDDRTGALYSEHINARALSSEDSRSCLPLESWQDIVKPILKLVYELIKRFTDLAAAQAGAFITYIDQIFTKISKIDSYSIEREITGHIIRINTVLSHLDMHKEYKKELRIKLEMLKQSRSTCTTG